MCAPVETEKWKVHLNLSLSLANVGSYDFLHPCAGPQNIHLILSGL